MTIVVEDGTGLNLAANSYASESELAAYASARGITIPAEFREMYLILSMDYFESLNFKGYKTSDTQPIQFPRKDLYIDNVLIESDVIHKLVKESQLEAAIAAFNGNSFTATKERAVKSERISGAVEVVYMDNAANSDTVVAFIVKVQKLLKDGGSAYFFKVDRV